MWERNEYTPLYLQFYEALKKKILSIPVGAHIPPERSLCDTYELDRVTVRKALALLAKEGYIERKQGSGTRVLCHEPKAGGTVLFLLCQSEHTADRLSEPFYARSLDALEEELQKINKRLLYSKVLPQDDLAALCKSVEAQAVILASTPDSPILKQCRALQLPLVCYNTHVEGFPSVLVDNDSAAAISAKHLWDLGHRRIGFIHVSGNVNSEKRLGRYKIEMRNAGLPEEALCIAEGDWSEASGYAAAKELLSLSDKRITALFGGNDSMAIGAMRAAEECGLRVPQDLSIIGFDGITQTPMTTLQVDVKAMAEATCMLLQHITERPAHGIHAMVSAQFLSRETTASPDNF